MICKKCGKKLKDLDLMCDKCYTLVDIDEHEKIVDEYLTKGLIKKKNKSVKKNYVICEKCGENVKIGKGSCGNCTHVLSEEFLVKNLQEAVEIIKKEAQEMEIRAQTRGLRFMCVVTPLLGLILKFVYKKSNPILSELCYDAWWFGLGRIRFIIVIVVLGIFLQIF